jgi:acetoin utilization deacetylase AcuC-like enzyme
VAAPFLGPLLNRLAGSTLPVWYSPLYRLPLSGTDVTVGIHPRRADRVVCWLVDCGAVRPADVHAPARISYDELRRVHTVELLDSLGCAASLAAVFLSDPGEIVVDELLNTVRLACGGTLAAARAALQRRGPALNLLGGFHQAAPGVPGRFGPVSDIAVAVAALRAEGFAGRVVMLDLDAHPPDGLAACFEQDASAWIGSISGPDPCRPSRPLPRVDETVLPEGTGDAPYLGTLTALLGRMPRADLAFVLAGGDVLAGDGSGRLGLTLEGARRRDRAVARALRGVPSVWVPAAGYHVDAWRLVAGTGMVLASRATVPIPRGYDPLTARLSRISEDLRPDDLAETEITAADIEDDLGLGSRRSHRLFLGYYTEAGAEHAMLRYGVLAFLRRLGYGWFRVEIGVASLGDRLRLFGQARGEEHLLIELIAQRRHLAGEEVLHVHWLSLRNPLARFTPARPRLPGQEVPGLGLAHEASDIVMLMARRLGLAGVVMCPTDYHMAYGARHGFAFVDPGRQGRFEALVRDLSGIPLLKATHAVSNDAVLLDGTPYAWEADEMALWLKPREEAGRAEVIARERERCHFRVEEGSASMAVGAPLSRRAPGA